MEIRFFKNTDSLTFYRDTKTFNGLARVHYLSFMVFIIVYMKEVILEIKLSTANEAETDRFVEAGLKNLDT